MSSRYEKNEKHGPKNGYYGSDIYDIHVHNRYTISDIT